MAGKTGTLAITKKKQQQKNLTTALDAKVRTSKMYNRMKEPSLYIRV